jgi:hypothetical protein
MEQNSLSDNNYFILSKDHYTNYYRFVYFLPHKSEKRKIANIFKLDTYIYEKYIDNTNLNNMFVKTNK